MNAQNAWHCPVGVFWPRDVELQMLVIGIPILNAAFKFDVIGHGQVRTTNRKFQDRGTGQSSEGEKFQGWHKASMKPCRGSSRDTSQRRRPSSSGAQRQARGDCKRPGLFKASYHKALQRRTMSRPTLTE